MRSKYAYGIGLLVAFLLVLFIGTRGLLSLQLRWLLNIGIALVVLGVVGREHSRRVQQSGDQTTETPGRWDGVFIDQRRKISLSRFQIVLWTVVALTAWTTLVLDRTYVVSQFVDIDDWITAMVTVSDEDNSLLQLALQGEDDPVPDAAGAATDAANGTDPASAADESGAVVTATVSAEPAPEAEKSTGLPSPEPGFSPLNVRFPQELLLAMGIGTASLAGAAIIKSNKATRKGGRSLEQFNTEQQNAQQALANAQTAFQPLADAVERAAALTNQNPDQAAFREALAVATELAEGSPEKAALDAAQKRVDELRRTGQESVGQVHVNESIAQARWTDMFNGEYINDYLFTDISKVQMFFFTVLIVFSYAALIWVAMGNPAAQTLMRTQAEITLPEFSDSLIVLLGISHAGYLVVKSAE